MEPLFRIQRVTKIYPMGEIEVVALREIDLELPQHELAVLLGPSGSGKSTLLHLLGGLDRPTSGSVFFHSTDLARLSNAELTQYRRHRVGFVFQFYNLIAGLTARENVELVTELIDDPMRAEEALDRVGLGDRMDHFPSQLSGGEQQRVAIARAIVKRPEVLLCDEPTGALDVATGIQVLEVIEQVHRDIGTSVVVITHNAVIADMAHRVIHLSSGRVADVRCNEHRTTAQELVW